jgi:hypothetical protein
MRRIRSKKAITGIIFVHTTKLLGSMILSAQVPGHPEVAYELPAQSPQNVISKKQNYQQVYAWIRRLTKDDGMIVEERQRIATGGRQLCGWLSPGGWIRGLTIRDVLRNGCAIKIP